MGDPGEAGFWGFGILVFGISGAVALPVFGVRGEGSRSERVSHVWGFGFTHFG